MGAKKPESISDFSADARADLVLMGLCARDQIPELCSDAGIPVAVLQQWTDDFLAAGRRALSPDVRNTGQSKLDAALCHKIIHNYPANLLVSRPEDGEILFRSESTESTYGRRENTRDHWADQEERKVFIDQLMQARRVENMFFRGRMYDGSEFPAQLSSRLIEHEGQTISITTSTDLTKARSMTQEIERANLRLNEAIAAFGDGVVLWDQEFRLVIYNDRLLEMFGIQRERPLLGISPAELQQVLLKTLTLPEHLSVEHALADGITAMRTYRKNLQMRTRDGRIIMFSTHKTNLDGYLCTFRDVTRRRRLEKEVAHQRDIVHQNEKLKALGELLAGVAHELNNPLSVVTGYSLMLQERLQDPVNKRRIDRIATAAERCARIVRTFLAMAREEPADLNPLSLNEVIETTLESVEFSLTSKNISVELDLAPSLPMIQADADQMIQLFTNLASNAGQALESNGTTNRVITFRTSYEEGSEDVTAEVIDNGPGVPADLQSRIFEPFFTTKEAGEGTGIGLAFCHRIVDTCGGRISLEPSPTQGARFRIQMPRYLGKDPHFLENASEVDRRRKAVRVLVVDDEVNVRDLLEDLLGDTVLQIVAVPNAKSALELLSQRPFDIVLSDVRMPGMDGREFYLRLIEIDPDYADGFAFITGDLLNAEVAKLVRESGVPCLEKPVIPAELNALINHLCTKLARAHQ